MCWLVECRNAIQWGRSINATRPTEFDDLVPLLKIYHDFYSFFITTALH